MKSIGIIGNTGRMGRLLSEEIERQTHFKNNIGFNRSQIPYQSMDNVFEKNDYIIDFSKPELITTLLKTAITHPKPLVICTTGWLYEEMQPLIDRLAQKTALVIAANTSIGSYLQNYFAGQLAKILNHEYDIDITEKHHRHKIDSPSGTALSLLKDIQLAKQQYHNLPYQSYTLEKGPRPEHFIGITAERTGNIPGDHEVSFTALEERLSIKHIAFDPKLFAKGAIRIINWLETKKPEPGIYTMKNVLNLV